MTVRSAAPWVAGAAFLLLASPCHAERLPARAYTTADGLACNQVNAVTQDARGFLWVATEDGLSRFDGRAFETFTQAHGLPDVRVNAVVVGTAGELWVATHRGLAVLAASTEGAARFEVVPLGSTPGALVVRDLAAAPRDGVWAATSDGLYRVHRSGQKLDVERIDLTSVFEPGAAQAVHSLYANPDGSVLCGATQRAFAIDANGRLYKTVKLPGWDTVNSILPDRDGALWLATRTGIVRVTGGDGGRPPRFDEVISSREPHTLVWENQITRTSDGHLWASGARLTEIDPRADPPRVVRTYDTANGLCAGGIVGVYEDREGNLWGAMQACGLLRIARRGLVSFDETDGLHQIGIASFVEDAAGTVCATEVNRVDRWHCYDGTKFTALAPRGMAEISYVGWAWNQAVVHDRVDGGWWVAAGRGLLRYPPEPRAAGLASRQPAKPFARELTSTKSDIFRVFEDSRSDIWVGRLGLEPCVLRWERSTGAFHEATLDGGGTWQAPSAFAEDRHGVVWVGFLQGDLRRADGDRLVPAKWTVPRNAESILGMLVDAKGRLWIATGEAGLWRVDDPESAAPEIHVYDRRAGLTSDRLLALTMGADGKIYTGSRSGVSVLDPASGRISQYTTADGLASAVVNAAFRDSRGRLWFGTYDGVSMLDPRAPIPAWRPPVLVTALSAGGSPQPISPRGTASVSGLVLEPGDSTIQIRMSAPAFAPGGPPKFQYRLEGDPAWSSASDEPSMILAHLAPGTYRADLRAVGADGVASEPAVVAFRVKAPFWRTWWFLAIVAVLCGTAIAAILRARIRRLVEIERVRTRIAMDLHDDVGSSLSQIALQGELTLSRIERGEGDAAATLGRMSESARELVDTMGDVVWSVDPRHDAVSDLARRMREFALAAETGDGPAIHLDLPDGENDFALGANVRRQTFLVFKEALTNALRHAAAGRIDVRLTARGRDVVLTVADDGRGFAPGQVRPDGHGLISMRKRAAACRGSVVVTSGPERGTTVTLEVPRS